MATENALEDLHDEIKDQLGVLIARIMGLDGEIPPACKQKLVHEADCLKRHGIELLKLIDTERIRLKSLQDPPDL